MNAITKNKYTTIVGAICAAIAVVILVMTKPEEGQAWLAAVDWTAFGTAVAGALGFSAAKDGAGAS